MSLSMYQKLDVLMHSDDSPYVCQFYKRFREFLSRTRSLETLNFLEAMAQLEQRVAAGELDHKDKFACDARDIIATYLLNPCTPINTTNDEIRKIEEKLKSCERDIFKDMVFMQRKELAEDKLMAFEQEMRSLNNGFSFLNIVPPKSLETATKSLPEVTAPGSPLKKRYEPLLNQDERLVRKITSLESVVSRVKANALLGRGVSSPTPSPPDSPHMTSHIVDSSSSGDEDNSGGGRAPVGDLRAVTPTVAKTPSQSKIKNAIAKLLRPSKSDDSVIINNK